MKEDLFFVLKNSWYDMIESEIKLAEYRAITPYWIRRLCTFEDYPKERADDLKTIPEDLFYDVFNNNQDFDECLQAYYGKFIPFQTVTFQRAYPKNPPIMTFEFLGIEVNEGNPEWGAEPGVNYFCISLGNKLSHGFGRIA